MERSILLLTGWATSCKNWQPIIPVLNQRFQVNCLTPPWESRQDSQPSLRDLDQFVQNLAGTLHSPTDIIAWSMGGLVAINLASRFTDLVRTAIFVSSTPRFVSRSAEQTGIDVSWFNAFRREFEKQPYSAMKRFLALLTKGDEYARQTLSRLRHDCRVEGYDIDECRYGLDLLERVDYSNELTSLQCNTLFIHGESDAVLPVSSGHYAASLANSKVHIIPAAGHAPQVSHPRQVAEIIMGGLE